MTAAEQLIEQGRAEGLSQGRAEGILIGRAEAVSLGRAEGILIGMRDILRRVLELRFGALSAESVAQLEAADRSTLDRYTDRVITAATLAEVLGS